MSEKSVPNWIRNGPLPFEQRAVWPGQHSSNDWTAFDHVFAQPSEKDVARMSRFQNDNPYNMSEEDLARDKYWGGIVGTVSGGLPSAVAAIPAAAQYGPWGALPVLLSGYAGTAAGGEYGGRVGLTGAMHDLDKKARNKNNWSGAEMIGRGAPGY